MPEVKSDAKPDAKPTNVHDEQTSATAQRLRTILSDWRSGAPYADFEAKRKQLEDLANDLDLQGKSKEEQDKAREQQGLPDPTKTTAELIVETQERDKAREEEERRAKEGADEMGKPVNTAQGSAVDRERQEAALHRATTQKK